MADTKQFSLGCSAGCVFTGNGSNATAVLRVPTRDVTAGRNTGKQGEETPQRWFLVGDLRLSEQNIASVRTGDAVGSEYRLAGKVDMSFVPNAVNTPS